MDEEEEINSYSNEPQTAIREEPSSSNMNPEIPPKKRHNAHVELVESQDDQHLSRLRKSLLPSADGAPTKKSPKTLRRTKSSIESSTHGLETYRENLPANFPIYDKSENASGRPSKQILTDIPQKDVAAHTNFVRSTVRKDLDDFEEQRPVSENYRVTKPNLSKAAVPTEERETDIQSNTNITRTSQRKAVSAAPSVPSPAASREIEESASAADMMIRVVVRKRPLSKSELNRQERDILEIQKNGIILVHEPKTKVDLTRVIETQAFFFDDAFDAHETNEEIYQRSVKPLVAFMFEGGKASCFAYGQTGSGKVKK